MKTDIVMNMFEKINSIYILIFKLGPFTICEYK